ncbi:MAG: M15 family metallopeptidase [Pseudomonadota bacterium]
MRSTVLVAALVAVLATAAALAKDGGVDRFIADRFSVFSDEAETTAPARQSTDQAAVPRPRKKPVRAAASPPAQARQAPAPVASAEPPPSAQPLQSAQAAPAQPATVDEPRRFGFLDRLTGGRQGDKNKRALLDAYPGVFRFEGNTIVFNSGERVVWDDGRRKSPAQLLTEADVEDMFAYPYPKARAGEKAPPRLHDPGRVRSQAFFKALYGNSSKAVGREVRIINWVPRIGNARMTVTTKFGIDRKIEAISAELERLPKRFHKYLTPPAGGFVWRTIAGTRRLSVHSFGAAVDINTKYANYWRWEGQTAGGTIPFRNQIPMEIVAVFEAHCFIWGGRWYHYDTMHFEYRPELLPGCRR